MSIYVTSQNTDQYSIKPFEVTFKSLHYTTVLSLLLPLSLPHPSLPLSPFLPSLDTWETIRMRQKAMLKGFTFISLSELLLKQSCLAVSFLSLHEPITFSQISIPLSATAQLTLN